jgi:uncharacterized protein (TIGR02147 family)
MISIFNYVNYRRFLKDYYLKAKAEKKYFSYRYFSRRAGINSPNFLKVVIEGKRNLSSTTIEKFASALGLDQKETVFFRRLVVFNQARTASEKQEGYIILREMANQLRQNGQGADLAGFIGKWYTNAVRELMTDQKSDLENAGPHPADRSSHPAGTKGVLTLWPQVEMHKGHLASVQTFSFQLLSTLTATTNGNGTTKQFAY